MKYLLPVIMLSLIACNGKGNHVPGWSKVAAQDFASRLGYLDAPTTCTEFVNIQGDSMSSPCAVRMGDKVYDVVCYKDGNNVNHCYLKTN